MSRSLVIAAAVALLPLLAIIMDFSLQGTYDALFIPILLPKSIVTSSLLPEQLSPGLLRIPADVLAELGLDGADSQDSHLVMLQLGYQHQTGPGKKWMGMRMSSFSEAKIEIPYMRHPSSGSDMPFVYKQTMVFSNRLMTLASKVIPGARTEHAAFTPARSPSCFEGDASAITYNVEGYIKAEATLQSDATAAPSWEAVKRLVEAPWFAERSAQSVVAFDLISPPLIAPQPYDVSLTLNVGALRHPSRQVLAEQDPLAGIGGEELKFHVKGWRAKSDFGSHSGTAAAFARGLIKAAKLPSEAGAGKQEL